MTVAEFLLDDTAQQRMAGLMCVDCHVSAVTHAMPDGERLPGLCEACVTARLSRKLEFALKLTLGTPGMQDRYDIAVMLEEVIRKLRERSSYAKIVDSEGTTVGEWEIKYADYD